MPFIHVGRCLRLIYFRNGRLACAQQSTQTRNMPCLWRAHAARRGYVYVPEQGVRPFRARPVLTRHHRARWRTPYGLPLQVLCKASPARKARPLGFPFPQPELPFSHLPLCSPYLFARGHKDGRGDRPLANDSRCTITWVPRCRSFPSLNFT